MASHNATRPSMKGKTISQSVSPRKLKVNAAANTTTTDPQRPPTTFNTQRSGAQPDIHQLALTNIMQRGPNPHVRAIQSRVADIVRQYNESMVSDMMDYDEDDELLNIPSRWKVGDVLLATHNALAKTGNRTERTIIAEFGDDPEIVDAIDEGEQSFGKVVDEAERKAQHMQEMIVRSIAMVKQLQLSDEEARVDSIKNFGEQGNQVRELKNAIEALHKEKTMVLTQLQDQIKAHKDLLVVVEEQNQELKKLQIAIAMKTEDVRTARDEIERRLSDVQQELDTSQQTATMWRDKFQAGVKNNAAVELKLRELEKKVQHQAEEIVKHEIILQAKNQEFEKQKERLKESELQRSKMEAAGSIQHHVPTEKTRGKISVNAGMNDAWVAEKENLQLKLKQSQEMVTELQKKLRDATALRYQFENDNSELTKLVREMQERARQFVDNDSELQRFKPIALRRSNSFSISLRSSSSRSFMRRNSKDSKKSTPNDDDLSTSSSDEDSDLEQEELEVNGTVQQVVASVFAHRQRQCPEETDELISRNIALFEDPKNTPMTKQLANFGNSSIYTPSITNLNSATPSIAVEDVESMKTAYDEELARMKEQYILGLVEYKRLVIEQYERRQTEIHERHRVEIENVIMFIQRKFKQELERRNEEILRAKESLKLLYRAMKTETPNDVPASTPSLTSTVVPTHGETVVSLKSLLRTAVLAMSTSTKRNVAATTEIRQIYETIKQQNVRATALTKSIVETKLTSAQKNSHGSLTQAIFVHAACQVQEADFEMSQFKDYRSNLTRPEALDDYVLPGTACFANANNGRRDSTSPASPRNAICVLDFIEGAAFSNEIVQELRQVIPSLPQGSYYLSGALKQKLLLELVRFYTLSSDQLVAKSDHAFSPRQHDTQVIIGSPRDTPFMRRKAVEAVEKTKIRQRRAYVLASGGVAILQSSPSEYPPLSLVDLGSPNKKL